MGDPHPKLAAILGFITGLFLSGFQPLADFDIGGCLWELQLMGACNSHRYKCLGGTSAAEWDWDVFLGWPGGQAARLLKIRAAH